MRQTVNFPPSAFPLFPYPSFHLASLILPPLHIPEVPVVVPSPNLQNPLKETNEKKKILNIHHSGLNNAVHYNYLRYVLTTEIFTVLGFVQHCVC